MSEQIRILCVDDEPNVLKSLERLFLDTDYEITKDLPAPAMPTAFIGGSRDGVIAGRPASVEAMASLLPDYRGTIMIEGAGHWTQQERPGEFNAAMIELLARLG